MADRLDETLRKKRENDEKVRQWYEDKKREDEHWALLRSLGLQGRTIVKDGNGKVIFDGYPLLPDAPQARSKTKDEGEAGQSKQTIGRKYLAKLRQNIAEYFNLDDLRTLCFDMGIKHENLAAATIDGMARELVAYCERTGCVPDLVGKCKELRPNVAWEDKQKYE